MPTNTHDTELGQFGLEGARKHAVASTDEARPGPPSPLPAVLVDPGGCAGGDRQWVGPLWLWRVRIFGDVIEPRHREESC